MKKVKKDKKGEKMSKRSKNVFRNNRILYNRYKGNNRIIIFQCYPIYLYTYIFQLNMEAFRTPCQGLSSLSPYSHHHHQQQQ